jgi:hypothetical protein
MWISGKRSLLLSFAGLIGAATIAAPAQGGEFWKIFTPVTAPAQAAHREEPATCQDAAIEELGRTIDWLEHHIDEYGTVVAKHPDVWGESRLTRHRDEYEKLMSTMMGQFSVTYAAAIARNDQASLGFALALNSAATSGTGSTAVSGSGDFNDLNTMLGTAGSLGNSSSAFALTNAGRSAFSGINTLSLEPKMVLQEMDGYLHYLQQLRRNNEGDDTKDSPGYALDLVRIPVSVLPGRKTREGYGAEITILATPYLTPELLPMTFRSMTENDLVDMLAPVVTQWVNDPDIQEQCKRAWSEQNAGTDDQGHLDPPGRVPNVAPPLPGTADTVYEEKNKIAYFNLRQLGHKLIAKQGSFRVSHASGTKSRRSFMPIPPSQIIEVIGPEMTAAIVMQTYQALNSSPVNHPIIGYLDVRNFLAEEINAAYIFLGQRTCDDTILEQESPVSLNQRQLPVRPVRFDSLASLETMPGPEIVPMPVGREAGPTLCPMSCTPRTEFWNRFCGPDLADAIRKRSVRRVYCLRQQYLKCIPGVKSGGNPSCAACSGGDADCHEEQRGFTAPCKTLTAALGWGLLVESSLLNEQLNQDYYEALIAKGRISSETPRQCISFYGSDPLPDARRCFMDYVNCRWPVRVFALDPVTDMQNVEDSYSRHRQLQIALAMGFASGAVNARTMMKFARQLDEDIQAVALNQTAVGFSSGDDTFGWRFYPRVQTPPTKGNAAALWESIAGGPTTDQDMRHRQLEPMARECVAIVIMPSFVPYVTFDTRTRFFKLTNPEHGEISMKQELELSRSIKSMQNSAAQCAACAQCYRDGEVERLFRRVHQLEQSLPLQTMQVQLPFENTSGGFELFNRGVTDLAPELVGWYGAPGIDPNGTTTLFLVGRSFSVNGMQVIAGGRSIGGGSMLSRQVLEVTIPPGAQFVVDESGNKLVDIHAATAYGVTDHLLIPVASSKASLRPASAGLKLVSVQNMTLAYSSTPGTTSPSSPNTYAIQSYSAPQQFIEIQFPQANPLLMQSLNVNLYLIDAGGATLGSQQGVPFVYSPQTGRYGVQLDSILLRTNPPVPSKPSIADLAQNYLNSAFANGTMRTTPVNCKIYAQVVPVATGTGANTLLVPVDGYLDLQLRPQ